MLELNLHKTLHSATGPLELAVELTLSQGEILALFGKSGAGKTTLLRIVAGLEQAQSGTIKWNGAEWLNTAQKRSLNAQARPLAMVFQDYALFPNMTVKQNIAFAQGAPSFDSPFVQELLAIMDIGKLAHRYPSELSGGQQQRVALARALARKPQLLLLDEPLSAIDDDARQTLQTQLLDLRKRYSFTAIIVSHDLGEIFRLADKVAVLDQGRITNYGTCASVFGNPDRTGKLNIPATILGITCEDEQFTCLLSALGQTVNLHLPAHVATTLQPGASILLCLGPKGLEWPHE
jgi:molybdate transport system ATP-binding protein